MGSLKVPTPLTEVLSHGDVFQLDQGERAGTSGTGKGSQVLRAGTRCVIVLEVQFVQIIHYIIDIK